jgi:hypothetical protein
MKLTTTLGVDFHTTSKSFPRVQIELYTPALPLLESSTNPILMVFATNLHKSVHLSQYMRLMLCARETLSMGDVDLMRCTCGVDRCRPQVDDDVS